MHDDAIIFRIIGSSNQPFNKFFRKMNRHVHYRVDLEHLDLSNIDVFFIEVCDDGFHLCKELLHNRLPPNRELYKFTCLREPYDRIVSIYNYTQSTQSSHESYHRKFDGMTFVQYLNSEMLESGWLIRKLLNIPDTEVVTKDHFDGACAILDNMLVFDINDIDSNIHKIFQNCYGIEPKEFTDCLDHCKNKTEKKENIRLHQLEKETRETWLFKSKWDRKIYSKYTTK